MGKSIKKIKNERINLIRQQYDAFLEEDKKRKERNEYILGKLDKMRSSMTLVPISTKTNYHLEANPYDFCGRPNSLSAFDTYMSHIERPKIISNINKLADESTVLKEISKNYILIPKRTRRGEEEIRLVDNIFPKDAIDDNDWKNKYNILNDLKKQEKEGQCDTALQQSNEMYLRGVIPKNSESFIYDKQISNFNQIDTPSKEYQLINSNIADLFLEKPTNKGNMEDIKENKIFSNTPHVKLPTSNDGLIVNGLQPKIHGNQINNPVINEEHRSQLSSESHVSLEYVSEKEKYNSDINEKNENYLTANINNLETNEVNIKIQAENQGNEHPLQDSIPTTDKSKYISSENAQIAFDISIQKPSSAISQELCTKDLSNKNEVLKQNQTLEKDSRVLQDFALAEQAKLCDDSENNHENQILLNQTTSNTHLPESGQETQKDVPHTPVAPTEPVGLYDIERSPQNNFDTTQHYQATEDVPPELEIVEQSEHINHDSEINAFEAEQKEMFYSEQTAGDTYEYNQGDGNNEEYNAQAYQQNDQYAYYEGVQQEQEYANINEHEESTERYDPHYNQQYEGTYESQQPNSTINYENTNVYDDQQYQGDNYEHQQFENTVNYETQHDNANYYQTENISNENDIQGNILGAQENQIYDQQMYSEGQETQEHIEQQLTSEEGYIENNPVNISEIQKENELDTETENNILIDGEPLPEPKMS